MQYRLNYSFLLTLYKKIIDICTHEEYLYSNESSGFYTKK